MPETRIERVVFVVGVVAIAALGFLVAHLLHHTHSVAAPSSLPIPAPATETATIQHLTSSAATTQAGPTAPTRTTTTANKSTTSADTRPATTTATNPGAVALLVTAKSDTWLEIRSGSSTGPLLYSGTLAAASTKTFRASTLWARFGAAGNVSARLDGKLVRLPSGTYSATFDGHGFRQTGA